MKKLLCLLMMLLVNYNNFNAAEVVNHINNGDFEKSRGRWRKGSASKIVPQTLGGNVKDIPTPNSILLVPMDKKKIKEISQKVKVDLNTKVIYLSFKYKKSTDYKSLNPAGLYNIRFRRQDKSSTFHIRSGNSQNNRWGYEIIKFTKIKGKRQSSRAHELTVSFEFFEAEGNICIDDVVLESYSSTSDNLLKQKQKKLSSEVLEWNAVLDKNAPLDMSLQKDSKKEKAKDIPLVNFVTNGDFTKGQRSWKSNVKVKIVTEVENKFATLYLKKIRDGVSFSQKVKFGDAKLLKISFKSKSDKKNSGQVKVWRSKKWFTYYKFSSGVKEWKTTTITYSGMENKKSIKLDFTFQEKTGTVSLDDIVVSSNTD